MRGLPRKVPKAPEPRPDVDGSITRLRAHVITRIADRKVIEGPWKGPELNAYEVRRSLFGGPHWLLRLGRRNGLHPTPAVLAQFVIDIDDPQGVVSKADAEHMAQTYLTVMNLNREES